MAAGNIGRQRTEKGQMNEGETRGKLRGQARTVGAGHVGTTLFKNNGFPVSRSPSCRCDRMLAMFCYAIHSGKPRLPLWSFDLGFPHSRTQK